MCVVNSEYNKVFSRIASASEEINDSKFIRDDGTPNEDMLGLSYQLKWVLENVCDGSSEAVVSSSASDHGFEIWRLLRLRYAGSSEMTALGLLTDLVQFKFNMSDFENDLAQFKKVSDFERMASEPL